MRIKIIDPEGNRLEDLVNEELAKLRNKVIDVDIGSSGIGHRYAVIKYQEDPMTRKNLCE